MTIECKRLFVEMTYDKPNYASFGPFYLVDCLNYTAYNITQRTQKMMHIIVYQDYTENTECIVFETIIANKVSINTEM